ncbi:uncharacterized protein DUF4845 [Nitrosomonas sp. Nm84]|uniref:DUF4845 domain-containing protein n=1 Tax=Nitrosomonas sp. Nm84 TaxID=200124 RepID=UPI000D753071|nr:DUF4845 domain-containing protein [Nitrosomonas sp. Nm84]PXW91153.1 uncharacterized protein DUF4845 [Nitrosomonas sp. Nm84]
MHYTAIRKQQGLSLSSLLIWSIILVLIAVFGMKLVPAYIEHSAITKNLKAIAKEVELQAGDPNQIRLSFSKRAQIDNIKSISGQDIKINRENGRVVLSAKYTVKIPLISNISLNIDFESMSH